MEIEKVDLDSVCPAIIKIGATKFMRKKKFLLNPKYLEEAKEEWNVIEDGNRYYASAFGIPLELDNNVKVASVVNL